MKPTHRVFCKDCNRLKILFESDSKAYNFIKYNADEIESGGGKRLKRVYYCPYCMGYHVTSTNRYMEGLDSTNKVVEAYQDFKSKVKSTQPTKQQNSIPNTKEIKQEPPILSSRQKEIRTKMRNLQADIQGLLDYYKDKSSDAFKAALAIENNIYQELKDSCDNIKAKTHVENLLKKYL
jgi:uncharacterized protein YukE